MASRIPSSVRLAIIQFPTDGPRGAVSRFCLSHNISRAQFYRVQAKAEADPSAAVVAASTAPKQQAHQVDPVVEAAALEIRAQLIRSGWDGGPVSVAAKMIERGLTPPSRATLARIFTRNGVVIPEPSKKPRAAYHRFEYPDPNGCWQLDGTFYKLDNGTTRCILQVEDDHARCILASVVAVSENSHDVIRVVAEAIRRHGAPVRFLTDNGRAFNQSRLGSESALERYLRSQGVEPICGRPGKPTTQGKNERLHQTLQKFLDANRPIYTTERLQELVDQFDDYYNTCRPHQSLGGKTPIEVYQAKPKAQPASTPIPPIQTIKRRRQPGETSLDPSPTAARWADRVVPKDGRIGVCNTTINVGKHHAGQTFHIMFDLLNIDVFDPDGTFLARFPRPAPAKQLTRYTIFATQIPLPLSDK